MAELKILTVVGARPQFIKAAMVCRAIAEYNTFRGKPAINEYLVHTGQHYDHGMSRTFFLEMEIPEPAVNLSIGSGSHGEMTGLMLAGVEKEILKQDPDLVLVYGDTNSTLAGALAASKLHIPVVHVEAGLRSYNRMMPEEINRVLTDHISDLLFCPSALSKAQLTQEGICEEGIKVVGDVMYDALLCYRKKRIPSPFKGKYALATLHRPENTDNLPRLRNILRAMDASPIPVVWTVHPRTAMVLKRENIAVGGNIRTLEPLSYFSLLGYLEKCEFVMTDSGGLQKEAYYLGKKCLTLRDETEWKELVQCDANRVLGADKSAITGSFPWAMEPFEGIRELYGKGDAGKRIVQEIVKKSPLPSPK